MRKKQLKKELEIYKARCQLIHDFAIDYDGARTIKDLKILIDELSETALGKYDEDFKQIIK